MEYGLWFVAFGGEGKDVDGGEKREREDIRTPRVPWCAFVLTMSMHSLVRGVSTITNAHAHYHAPRYGYELWNTHLRYGYALWIYAPTVWIHIMDTSTMDTRTYGMVRPFRPASHCGGRVQAKLKYGS